MGAAANTLLCALAAFLCGCAASRNAAPPTVVDPVSSDLVAAEGLALWLGPAGPVEAWMRIESGTDAGKSWHVVPTDAARNADGALASFTLVWTLEGESAPRSERFMVVETDGDLAMARVVQHDRSVITAFDPPVLVMPARLNPGAVVRQDSEVVVYELRNPKLIKERGEASVEARFEGEADLPAQTGTDPTRARVFVTHLRLNLRAARSDRTTTRWFALPSPTGPGGLLREAFEESIRVLGVTIESSRQTMTLVGTADPTCATPNEPTDPQPGIQPTP